MARLLSQMVDLFVVAEVALVKPIWMVVMLACAVVGNVSAQRCPKELDEPARKKKVTGSSSVDVAVLGKELPDTLGTDTLRLRPKKWAMTLGLRGHSAGQIRTAWFGCSLPHAAYGEVDAKGTLAWNPELNREQTTAGFTARARVVLYTPSSQDTSRNPDVPPERHGQFGEVDVGVRAFVESTQRGDAANADYGPIIRYTPPALSFGFWPVVPTFDVSHMFVHPIRVRSGDTTTTSHQHTINEIGASMSRPIPISGLRFLGELHYWWIENAAPGDRRSAQYGSATLSWPNAPFLPAAMKGLFVRLSDGVQPLTPLAVRSARTWFLGFMLLE